MSRFLRGKKRRVVIGGIILLGFLALVLAQLYVIIILLIILYYLNKRVVNYIWQPTKRLGAKREVEIVDTLVIGDICSRSILEKYCDLSHSMVIMAPDRSLKTSSLILSHVESVICDAGTVVIVASRNPSRKLITSFDIPFFNRITALELGIDKKSVLYNFPILLHPIKCIKLLGGYRSRKLEECPKDEIVKLCKRKGFNLVYLV